MVPPLDEIIKKKIGTATDLVGSRGLPLGTGFNVLWSTENTRALITLIGDVID
jgi:hypothetical protein